MLRTTLVVGREKGVGKSSQATRPRSDEEREVARQVCVARAIWYGRGRGNRTRAATRQKRDVFHALPAPEINTPLSKCIHLFFANDVQSFGLKSFRCRKRAFLVATRSQPSSCEPEIILKFVLTKSHCITIYTHLHIGQHCGVRRHRVELDLGERHRRGLVSPKHRRLARLHRRGEHVVVGPAAAAAARRHVHPAADGAARRRAKYFAGISNGSFSAQSLENCM